MNNLFNILKKIIPAKKESEKKLKEEEDMLVETNINFEEIEISGGDTLLNKLVSDLKINGVLVER
jgi:hypothetical protein